MVRASATLRFKLWVYFCSLDCKKWIGVTSLLSMQVLSLSFFIFYELTLPLLHKWLILSRLACWLSLTAILSFPLLLLHQQPLSLLKSTFIIYKRCNYHNYQLWLFFYLNYIENILYALIVLCIDGTVAQLATIITILGIKLVYFKNYIKKIEILKILTLMLFFASVLVACEMAETYSNSAMQGMAAALLLVIAV
jgi:hypothetical protein